MANTIMFFILAVLILGSAVMCVATKRIMRAATFMLLVLFGVAGLYFLLDYTFLGAAQISVYAGGVTMIYVFAIQLVNKQTLQGMVERLKGSRVAFGSLVCLVGLATVALILLKNQFIYQACAQPDTEVSMQAIGTALLGADKYQYILPFEFISVFLLACIIGGLMVSRKEGE
jgi:NADH-quinone oxidoreductase subunit J